MTRGRDNTGRQPRLGLIVAALAFAGMGASFMQTILLPIQSELPMLLNASRGDTAWVITITLLTGAICTPIAGRLGDMFGKRRVALLLLSLLVTGSVVAALSSSAAFLIIGRGLQGMGLGVIPLGIALLRDLLPAERLGSAVALVSATLGVGGAIGLPISAFVTENYDWHLLFWVSAAIGALSMLFVYAVVPPSPLRGGGRFDVVGALGLAASIGAILLAISKGNEWGWASPATLGCLLGGVAVFAAWVWFELRDENPLIDIRVSVRGSVMMTNLASIAMGFALFASSIVFPQLLQLPPDAGLGLSLLHASLVLVPSGLAMLAMSPIAGRIERTFGPRPLLVAGAVIIAAAYLLAVVVDLEVWHVLIINTVIGVGIGLGYAAMPTLIMAAVPTSETGAANGINTLMRSLGTTVAAAAVASILANSSSVVAGVQTPSSEGFSLSLMLGLGAAVVCAVIALFIPKPPADPEAHG